MFCLTGRLWPRFALESAQRKRKGGAFRLLPSSHVLPLACTLHAIWTGPEWAQVLMPSSGSMCEITWLLTAVSGQAGKPASWNGSLVSLL